MPKRLIFAVLGLLAIVGQTAPNIQASPTKLEKGINLTDWFQGSNFDEKRFAELARLRQAGLDFIRLPLEPTRFYDAKSADWSLLRRTSLEAQRLGLRLIMDLHPAYNTQRLALTGDTRYTSLLTDLGRFALAFPETLLIELMNEPVSPVGESCNPSFDWNSWQQKFYTAVRRTNPNITLILTGACWGGIDGLLAVKPIQDNNLIYSFHYYDPMIFTHQSASWTSDNLWYLKNVPYPPTPEKIRAILPEILYDLPAQALKNTYRAQLLEYGASGFTKASIERSFQQAVDWARKNKTRLLLGEFGVYQPVAPAQDRVQFIADVRQTAQAMGIAYALWEYNPNGGFSLTRDGLPERQAFSALGLTVPANAVPTPKNPVPATGFPVNPVSTSQVLMTDFSKINLVAYGQPKQATFKAVPSNGRLEFDYAVPLNNDYGGVIAVIPLAATLDTRALTHLRLDMGIENQGGEVRVSLVSSKVDTGADHPQFTVNVPSSMTSFRLPIARFAQAGWGKKIVVADVLKQVSTLEITALSLGKPGRVKIDNIAFITITDANNPTAIAPAKQESLTDFSQAVTFEYSEKPALPSTSSLVVNQNSLQMSYALQAGNTYAGALLHLPIQPRSLLDYAAVRLELAATGTSAVRLELATTLETQNDNPQFILNVSPNKTSYRIPISEFAQAGWGKPVDILKALQSINAVRVYADTPGTTGLISLHSLMFEKKP